jgi:hypothetical protein
MSSDIQPAVPAAPPPPPARKVFVSRRTYEGMQPRKPKVPTTAEDSLALRAAELKRTRKDERRAHALRVQRPIQRPASAEGEAATLEPMAPCAFVVIEPSGDA